MLSAPVKVLVVDDHELVAEALALLLDGEPSFEVVGRAGTAEEAVKLADRHHPAVAVIDYRLADSDGVKAAQEIRNVSPASEMVMITASVEQAAVRGALEAGFCGFVSKGAPASELLDAVRSAASGQVHFSQTVLATLVRARSKQALTTPANELTARELEVLRLVADGRGTGEMAAALSLSQHTVRNHVRNILTKLDAHSKLEAVVIAARAGLIDVQRNAKQPG